MAKGLTGMFIILWRWIASAKKKKRRKAIIDDLDRAIEECRMKKRETDDFYDFEDTSDTDDIGDIDDFGF